jgi:hypothetical protein
LKGKILDYNLTKQEGLISAENGERYKFTTQEWRSSTLHPKKDLSVDFSTDKENNAKDIYALEQAVSPYANHAAHKETSTLAIVSFVFGIIGLFFDWWMFALPSIVAIITGHLAKSRIKQSDGMLEGNGFATAGLVLGYIVILLYLLTILLFAGVLVSLGSSY